MSDDASGAPIVIDPDAPIGFVGTGNMGNPMAANLLHAGRRLTVHDIRRASAENLLDEGAVWADSPAAVAAAAGVVFVSLPGPADVDEVVPGDHGLLAGAGPGTVIVALSTTSPEVVRALARRSAEDGVTLLDAPVSGGVAGARKGTLAVMVGGDEATFEACRPLFEVIGQRIFYLGPSGAGSVAKLVNNLLFFHGLMGSLEALVLAGKAGVDLSILRDVVQASSGGSFVWDFASRAILKDRLAPNFSVTLAAKDADLALGLAEQLGVPTPIGSHVGEELRRYRDNGYAAEDVLSIVKALEADAGVTVRGTGLS